MKNTWKLKLGISLFLATFFIFSCENNESELNSVVPQEKIEAPIPDPEFDEKALEELLAQLNAVKDIQTYSVPDQLEFLQEYMQEQGLEEQLDNAIAAYHDGAAISWYESPTEEQTFILSHIDEIHELIYNYGFNQELWEALIVYREEFLAASGSYDVSEETVTMVLSVIQTVSFAATNPVSLEYISHYSVELLNGAMGDQLNKSDWRCYIYVILIGIYAAKCATGNILSCALLVYYIAELAAKCPGQSVYVDPCLTSTDPCCGVSCIQGYTCNSFGNCVPDPNYLGCQVTGCPLGEQCLNNICVPW